MSLPTALPARPVCKTGDIITSIGGIALDGTHSFINTLFTYKPGDQVTVVFMRNGQSQQVQITLGETSQWLEADEHPEEGSEIISKI